MKSILFLCVANSARSQMAEGLARQALGPHIQVQSAGSKPSFVHPMAILVMGELGIDLKAHRSKGVETIDLGAVDLIVTLCAEEVCPYVPAAVARLHWPIPDPAAAQGEAAQLAAFRQARDEIKGRLGQLT